MGLFDKKKCDICSKDIGLLGNRKCQDGNICKACAGKLSPWFRGRKKTSVAKLKEQLNYRAANEEKVKSFNVSRSYGNTYRILVDDTQKAFLVTSRDKWRDTNPDVVPLDRLKACDVIVTEYKNEKKKEDSTSYDPKQYALEYAFNADLTVDTQYFNSIKFELSQSGQRPADKESESYKALMEIANRIQKELRGGEIRMTTGIGSVNLDDGDELEEGEWKCTCGTVNDSNYCRSCGKSRPDGVKWFCPDCGTEGYGKFCTNCGRKKPD